MLLMPGMRDIRLFVVGHLLLVAIAISSLV
jgi:hypothetical protein